MSREQSENTYAIVRTLFNDNKILISFHAVTKALSLLFFIYNAYIFFLSIYSMYILN